MTLACWNGQIVEGKKLRYQYINITRVVGQQAIKRINDLYAMQQQASSELQIKARVTFGDLNAEPFTYKSGEKQGQAGASVKGRLLKIDSVDVNGQRIDFGDDDCTSTVDGAKLASSEQPEQPVAEEEKRL